VGVRKTPDGGLIPVIKALLNNPVSRPVALLGLIGSGSLVVGGLTTLIPDSGLAGVIVTVLAGVTALYYAYHLVRGKGGERPHGD
jgi:hypothetical protein